MNNYKSYDISNWYWLVGDNLSLGVYSSKRAAYISLTDATYVAWLAMDFKPTIIDSQVNLEGVLMTHFPAGWINGLLRNEASALLVQSDITAKRIGEAVVLGENTLTSADVVAYTQWVRAIRAIATGSNSTATELPAHPGYPAGTN